MSTKIEWTDETWNPVTGCNKISPGCKFCYAKRLWKKVYPGREFEDVQCHPERLEHPLHWKKPRMIFVNSMSDLFHEKVPFEFIEQVFAVMALSHRHTFQVLTKRPARMLEYLSSDLHHASAHMAEDVLLQRVAGAGTMGTNWPLPNVWLGVSVEDQKTADERIPLLLQTPAAVRWVSYEPALGPVDFTRIAVPQQWIDDAPIIERGGEFVIDSLDAHDDEHYFNVHPALDWIVCGGESGPGVRPMHPAWARSVRDQCQAAGVAFFFKQHGEWISLCDYEPAALGTDTSRYAHEFSWRTGTKNEAELPISCYRVGKKAAGRLLDGREWNEMPAALSPAPATKGQP